MTSTSGARLLVDALVDNGVSHVLNIAGLGMWEFVEAVCARPDDLRYVTAVNESVLTLAADGFGRATGRPAFANLYFSSGTALGLIGISTAWADRVPLILATTTNDRGLDRRDGYAAVPERITDVTRQYAKWGWEVPTAARIPEAISRAVTIATAPPMGPVHLGLPMDLFAENVEQRGEWSGTRPVLHGRRAAAADAVAALADALLAAQRPVILAGGGLGRGGAGPALRRLAEALGAVVVAQSGRVVSIPVAGGADWYAGPITENLDLFDQADLAFSIGFEFGEVPGGALPVTGRPSLRLAELVESETDLGKHFSPHVGAVGDVAPSLAAVADLVETARLDRPEPWAGDRGAANLERIGRTIEQMREACGGPAPVLAALTRLVDDLGDRLCVVDQSNFGTVYLDAVVPRLRTENYIAISQKASAQGWGVPAALGAQLARPEQRVVAVVGDGGFMFTSGAIYTAARLGLPVIVVAINNGGWGGGGYNYRIPGSGDTFIGAFDTPPVDLAALAASLGVRSERVFTDEEARQAAGRAVRHDGPTLIEAMAPPSGMEMIRKRRTVWRKGMSG